MTLVKIVWLSYLYEFLNVGFHEICDYENVIKLVNVVEFGMPLRQNNAVQLYRENIILHFRELP